jgi:hypothetical protein
MDKSLNANEWAGKFLNGEFNAKDVRTQCNAGWWDWFCKDESLARKTQVLGKKVTKLLASDKIDGSKVRVWFKNNCPCNGPLFDDIRFADLETGDCVFTVVPKDGHTGKAEIWGPENNFDGPLVSGTWKDVKTFFGI